MRPAALVLFLLALTPGPPGLLAQGLPPDISLTLSDSRDPVVSGRDFTYHMRLSNSGSSAAAPLTLSGTLPEGLSIVSLTAQGFICAHGARQFECLQGSVLASSVRNVDLRVRADAAGYYTFSAQAAFAADPTPADNQGSAQTAVLAQDGSIIFPASPASLHPLFQDTFVGVAIFNPSQDSRQAAAYVRRGDGTLTGQFLLDPPMDGLSQLSRLSSEISQGEDEANIIEVFGIEGPLRGFFLVGDFSGRRLDGLGERLLDLDNFVLPMARTGEDAATLVYLFNPNRTSFVQVRLELFDGQGQPRGELEELMPPSSSLARTLQDLFAPAQEDDPAEELNIEDGYIKVQSSLPVRAFQLVATPEAILSAAARASETTRFLNVPHFAASNRGTDTEFRLINLGPETLSAEFSIFNEFSDLSGTLLRSVEPGQVLRATALEMLDEANRPPPNGPPVNLSGFVRVDAFVQSGAVRRATEVIGTVSVETPRAASLLPILSQPEEEGLFLQVAHDDASNIFTGLVIFNPNQQLATVDIEIFTADGNLRQEKTLLLAGNARAINLLASPTYFGTGFSQLGGHFRIRSNRPVFTMALFGDFSQRFLASIAAQ